MKNEDYAPICAYCGEKTISYSDTFCSEEHEKKYYKLIEKAEREGNCKICFLKLTDKKDKEKGLHYDCAKPVLKNISKLFQQIEKIKRRQKIGMEIIKRIKEKENEDL